MKKKLIILLFAVLSLSACGQKNTQEPTEETTVSEEVQEESSAQEEAETEEAIAEPSETIETETNETSEMDAITPEEAAEFSHHYTWGLMEFEGEDSFVMEIDLKGSPKAPDSTMTFRVLDSIFDYKPFTKISCGELVVDKETYPDWATDGLTDGIFGFVEENFTITTDEEEAEKSEPFVVTFSYMGDDGTLYEYSITWNPDGTAEVNEGSLTEK